MQSTTDQFPYGGAALPPPPPQTQAPSGHSLSSTATEAPPAKRRHRVDSNPLDRQWGAAASSSPTTASAAAPDSKRARISSSSYHNENNNPNIMSSKAFGKRAVDVIDLTQSGASSPQAGAITPAGKGLPKQHHIGARKLTVKNLRAATPARTASVNEYFAQRRREIDEALADVFAGNGGGGNSSNRQQPTTPARYSMDRIYRGVEDLCRHGEAKQLAGALEKAINGHLEGDQVTGRIVEEAQRGDDVGLLKVALGLWARWKGQLLVVRWMFGYLDRSYLLSTKGATRVNDMGIHMFRRAILGNSAALRKEIRSGSGQGEVDDDTQHMSPGRRILAAMCQFVDFDRRGDERFDSAMLKESVNMLRLFEVYGKFFEPLFLAQSHEYFLEFAEDRSVSLGLKDYIIACEKLLEREDRRCDVYNFDSTTKRQLRDDAHHILVEKYADKLLESGGIGKLLDANDVESMAALYRLLKLSSIQKRLKGPWESYIREAGASIVSDIPRGDEMVLRLLELRRALDIMVRDAFEKDEDFTYGLREAFGYFINDRAVSSKWNTGTSKVGEMIAKYIDMLLRGGLKTIPKSLLSDNRDRADAEKSGLASTGDEDAELDRQLDHALELFRFIEGKDVFEAFYKKDLARRLLMGRSASQDAERNMLSKLKSECGSSFTHNLEQMFRDQELAKDEMKSYKDWLSGTGRTQGERSRIDLTVSILSAAAWPSYPDVRVLLPKEVLDQILIFDKYYKSKHTGRRLTWMHNLAHCVVSAQFDKGRKELQVSAFQAAVLVLFNEAEDKNHDGVLSYEQISHSTGLTGGDLERTLQSLACGKVRVLTKRPRGRDVSKTDTFAVNKAFTDPKFRVKINQIQLKETKEENKETHQRVAADRQFETQAAIVRIMKSRKTMTHVQLVAEVINQTKSRGAVDPADIKTNIEKLIEKDYIEREGGAYTYLA